MNRANVSVLILAAIALLATFVCCAVQSTSRQIFGPVLDPASPARILLIGNSHTFMNDLPRMLSDLATSAGIVTGVEHIAFGGFRLAQHAVNGPTLARIDQEPWDLVVLQESTAIQLEALVDEMKPAVIALDAATRAVGGRTLLVMMWAPYATSLETGVLHQHQQELARITVTIAEAACASVAPAGLAWEDVQTSHETIRPWSHDRVHAREAGTFLTACVLFATIWGESPAGLAFPSGFSEVDAKILQEVAARVVEECRNQQTDET